MRCPDCKSERVKRYGSSVDCIDCRRIGTPAQFGAVCTCAKPHPLPVWYCAAHGEVAVDAG